MRIRNVFVAVASALALFISVQPAAAQSKPEFSVGYSFLRGLEDGGENVPGGWGASVSGGNKIKLVGDISGHHKDGIKLYFFQGGAEFGFGAADAKSAPYIRLLAGMGRQSASGFSDTAFVFTPEVGVKVKGSGRVGARIAAGFPIVREDGDTFKYFRLFFGISIQ